MTTELQTVDKKTLSVLNRLKAVEQRYKKLGEQRDALKEKLVDLFEVNEIKKFENDEFSITYVNSTTQDRFDSKKFQKDYPTIYPEYVTKSPVKAHIRFKVKGE